MEKTRLMFILALCFGIFFSLMSVSAQPPQTQVQEFPEGYLIIEETHDYLKINEDYTYNFFVKNQSTGEKVNNLTVNCTYFLTNKKGVLLFSSDVEYNGEYWNLTIKGGNFTNKEGYPYAVSCESTSYGGSLTGILEVTSTGRNFDEADAFSGIGILFGSLIISFLFMTIGWKLSESEKLMPLSLLFVSLAFILVIYALFTGWTLGANIIDHESFSEPAEIIFTAFLWLLGSMAIISVVLMFFAFVKELGTIAEKKKFGEGWNPISATYDY